MSLKIKWTAELVTYKGTQRILVRFEREANAIARIKNFEDAKWSKTLGAWHLPNTQENRLRFKIKVEADLNPNKF